MESSTYQPSADCGSSETEGEIEKHQQAAATIYDVTNACFDLFERLSSASDGSASSTQTPVIAIDPSDESPGVIKGLLNNFSFWIDFTGALAPVGASLDDRLHGNEEVKEIVLELLEMIDRNLRRLERTKDESIEKRGTTAKKCVCAVDSALDRLHFIARAVRKAAVKKKDQNILNFVSEEDNDDKVFRSMAISYAKWMFPEARPSLREHMGAIVARRRRILLQQHRHAEKLGARRTPSRGPDSDQIIMPSVKQGAMRVQGRGGSAQALPSAANSKATEASKLDLVTFQNLMQEKPILSTRRSGSSQQGVSEPVEYPEPPPIGDDEKYVKCHYCLEPLSADIMRKRGKNDYWKLHVDQHLQPYVCLFRRCANFCFASPLDWENHMDSTHSHDWPRKVHSMTWYCDLDHHDLAEFHNETDWREHMKDIPLHPSCSSPPTEAHLDVLVVQKQVLAPRDPFVCPFCEDKPQKIAILGDRGIPTDMKKILMEHITDHMLSFSFLSLPSVLNEATEKEREKKSIILTDSSRRRVRNLSSLPQPPSGVEFLEDISLTFDDYISESERRIRGRSPVVPEVDTDHVTKASENGPRSDSEISIPDTNSDFSWDFIPASEVPFGDVDAAFEKWTEDRVGSIAKHFIVPYARNEGFVGRRQILEQLKSYLNQYQADSISHSNAVLFGQSGIGKTQIALAYVYELQDSRQDMSVFWVNARNVQSFHQGYTEIAKKLQITGHDDLIMDSVRRWLETKTHGAWLMVIDGADEESTQNQISQHIPRCAHGSILVTTRNNQLSQNRDEETFALEIDKLNENESRNLLQEKLGGYDFDPEDLSTISARLGHVPLTLVQAAALIQESALSVGEFLRLIRRYDLGTNTNESERQIMELVEKLLGKQHSDTLPNMASYTGPRSREEFEFAVVCALPFAYDAVTLAFDEFWAEDADEFGRAPHDLNTYATGRMGQHNVVVTLLPSFGKLSFAGAAASLRSSYTRLKLVILAGICGGVPGSGTEVDEMILGDVVISESIIQCDLGRQYPDHFGRKYTFQDSLTRPNRPLRSLLAMLRTEFGRKRLERGCADVLEKLQRKAIEEHRQPRYRRPTSLEDSLFKPRYLHLHRNWEETGCGCSDTGGCQAAAHTSCKELGCDQGHLVHRKRLADGENQAPRIFIGNMASVDSIRKSGEHRDRLAQELGIIAFDMDGSGAWDELPFVVVKGVCDYADGHWNKEWQPYAAIAAASAARTFLGQFAQ